MIDRAAYESRLNNLRLGDFGVDRFTAATPKPRCGVYVRVSGAKQTEAQALSLPEQLSLCLERAAMRDWEPVAIYYDVMSGASRQRRAFQQLLTDIRRGEIDGLVAWKDDRVYRGIHPAADLDSATRSRSTSLAVEFCAGSQYDAKTLGLFAWVAGIERENITERMKMGRLAAAKRGRVPVSRPAFGYRQAADGGWEIDEEQATLLRECASRVIAGESLTSICDDLTRRGVPRARSSRPWPVTVLWEMLTNPALTGTMTYGGVEVWVPPIFTPDECALIQRPRSSVALNRATTHPAPLAGILRCSVCGCLMTGAYRDNSKQRYRRKRDGGISVYTKAQKPTWYYRCGAKSGRDCRPTVAVWNHHLFPRIWDYVARVLTDADFVESLIVQAQKAAPQTVAQAQAECDAEVARLTAITRREVTYTDSRADGILSDEAYRTRMTQLRAERVVAEERLSEARTALLSAQGAQRSGEALRALAQRYAASVPLLDNDARVRLVRLLVARVEVGRSQELAITLHLGCGIESEPLERAFAYQTPTLIWRLPAALPNQKIRTI